MQYVIRRNLEMCRPLYGESQLNLIVGNIKYRTGKKKETCDCVLLLIGIDWGSWKFPMNNRAEISCDVSQAVNNPKSYPNVPSTMTASDVLYGDCSQSSKTGYQTRFAEGTTKQTLKCVVSGQSGILSGQPTGCGGLVTAWVWNSKSTKIIFIVIMANWCRYLRSAFLLYMYYRVQRQNKLRWTCDVS